MESNCTNCGHPYIAYTNDFLKCFSCNQKESKKMIDHINRPKIPQANCTKHLTIEQKKEIAAYIAETHGDLYRSYYEAVPFISEKFSIKIDYSGVRSIVNSKYFRELAFED